MKFLIAFLILLIIQSNSFAEISKYFSVEIKSFDKDYIYLEVSSPKVLYKVDRSKISKKLDNYITKGNGVKKFKIPLSSLKKVEGK